MPKYEIVPSEEGISIEDARAEFHNDFAKVEDLHKTFNTLPTEVQGKLRAKLYGEIDSELKKVFNEYGLEFEEKNTKGNLNSLINFNKEQIEAKEAEIALAKKGGESVEEVEKLKTELSNIKELNKDLKLKYKEKTDEVDKVKSEYTAKEKAAIVRNKLSEAKSRVRLVDDKVLRKAVDYDLAEYEFEIDEDGKDVVKKNGQIIKSSLNTGEFASYDEILQVIAEQNNALIKTTASGQHNPNAYSGTPPKNKAAF